MERVSNKHDENLPAATLYLDDVIEIIDTFSKACTRLEISAGEYKIADPTELKALADKFPVGKFEDLKIQGFEPFVSLELRSYGARTYISEDSLEQRVVVTSAREVLQRCRKIKPDNLVNITFFALIALTAWSVTAKSYYLVGSLALASFTLLTITLNFRMNTIIVYTRTRADSKTFFQRKKDEVLLAVIAAALGAAASYAVIKLLP